MNLNTDLEKLYNAKSIKHLESFAYRGIPVIIIPKLSRGAIQIIYIPFSKEQFKYFIRTIYRTKSNKILMEGITQSIQEEIRRDIKHSINKDISFGDIIDFGETEPDYEFLDNLFFRELKRLCTYLTQQNEEYLSTGGQN